MFIGFISWYTNKGIKFLHSSIIEDSIVTEFGFTCGQKYVKSIIGAIYMVGVLIGSFGFGILSDRFGRIKTLM